MTTVLQLLAIVGVVFAINLLPAFGPPTWAVLVFARVQWPDVPPAALITGGVLAATTGRLVLAAGTRTLGGRLPPERRANLEALGRTLATSKTGAVACLAVFVFSPLPSAQMFMAAGLADVPLLPLAGAFLIGRSISFTLYVTAAGAAGETIQGVLRGEVSPSVIAIQVGALAALILMIKIDWITVIDWTRTRVAHMRGKPAPPSVRPSDLGPPKKRRS